MGTQSCEKANLVYIWPLESISMESMRDDGPHVQRHVRTPSSSSCFLRRSSSATSRYFLSPSSRQLCCAKPRNTRLGLTWLISRECRIRQARRPACEARTGQRHQGSVLRKSRTKAALNPYMGRESEHGAMVTHTDCITHSIPGQHLPCMLLASRARERCSGTFAESALGSAPPSNGPCLRGCAAEPLRQRRQQSQNPLFRITYFTKEPLSGPSWYGLWRSDCPSEDDTTALSAVFRTPSVHTANNNKGDSTRTYRVIVLNVLELSSCALLEHRIDQVGRDRPKLANPCGVSDVRHKCVAISGGRFYK